MLDGPTNPVKREVVSDKMRADMYDEQHGECAYCSKVLTQSPADFDLDHIIPVRRGGPTCRSNLHLLCVRCHRTKSSTERRTGAMLYCPPVYPSDSVVLMSRPGFQKVRPADLPGLTAGTYSLDYGPHKQPRPASLKRVTRRGARRVNPVARNVSPEDAEDAEDVEIARIYSILQALEELLIFLGYKGFNDYTTEICLRRVDIGGSFCRELIAKLRKMDSGRCKSKTLSGLLAMWLKRYTDVELVARQAGKLKNRRSLHRLRACAQDLPEEGGAFAVAA